jgi:hypothetical protein
MMPKSLTSVRDGGFEFCDPAFEGRDQLLHFGRGVARGDVLLTVPIQREHVDEEEALHGAGDLRLGELGEELGMFRRIFDPGVTDDLEARAVRVTPRGIPEIVDSSCVGAFCFRWSRSKVVWVAPP